MSMLPNGNEPVPKRAREDGMNNKMIKLQTACTTSEGGRGLHDEDSCASGDEPNPKRTRKDKENDPATKWLYSKRKIAICLSTEPSAYHAMLHASIGCDSIYSKSYQNGTLYGLILSKAKTTLRLDKDIVSLDSMIQAGSGKTRFVSISSALSGKVKTFACQEHAQDEHFKALFSIDSPGGGRALVCNREVKKWVPPLRAVDQNHQIEEDLQQLVEDENVQQQVMEELPQDFCVSNVTSMDSNLGDSKVNSSKTSSKLRRMLEISMVQSAINPICPKHQRALRNKSSFSLPAGNSTGATNSSGNTLQQFCGSASVNINQEPRAITQVLESPCPDSFCNIEEHHALGSENGDDEPDSLQSADQNHEVPELPPTEEVLSLDTETDANLIPDESSRDSSDSMQALSDGSKYLTFDVMVKMLRKQDQRIEQKIEEKINKKSQEQCELIKEIKGDAEKLLSESEARDFLVARTLAQDDEITYHKRMRDVQEGKTAAQTSKANKALRNEAEALKEAADANVAAASERERREVAETERSGLIAANVNMAIAIRNGSAGIQNQTIEDWKLKAGYEFVESFTSLLKYEDGQNLDKSKGFLKEVPPLIPFQDIAFRRYHDHCMAYRDFKEASKSVDKHRLYLGLLGNAPYPEAVVLCFRERLVYRIEDLCGKLGKIKPPLDELMPPIQGNPFDTEELKQWAFSPEKFAKNSVKIKSSRHNLQIFEPETLWNYQVMLHRCGFEGNLRKDDSEALHRMLEGPMYDEEAFMAMEAPLLECLISLREELKSVKPVLYTKYVKKWGDITWQMERPKDSGHRKLTKEEGRRNEYIIFFQNQQRALSSRDGGGGQSQV